jgi:Leucine-rich repeat (LRR) protein
MSHSLIDLKTGKLIGLKRLKLACGLNEFPKEILSLSETLEVLDLSGNQLTSLPDSISNSSFALIIYWV